jgi:bifunctional non-homologous end joining protein LigD
MAKAATIKSAKRSARFQFVQPMYAQFVQQLPECKDWLYEMKFDGYRCLAPRDAAGGTLWSRRSNNFTAQFLNIAKPCERLPPRTLLDGEIVAIDETACFIQLTAGSSLAGRSVVVPMYSTS